MSSPRALLPDARRQLIADRLRAEGSISVAGLEAELGISPMTARRDLAELERQGLARRTHGGAVLPGLSAHEDSFAQRMEVGSETKERLAAAALQEVQPGEAIFLDCSTTAFHAARLIVRDNVECTLLTNSVPVMELVARADSPRVQLIGIGGTLRTLTRSFVGPSAVAAVEGHFADHALLSVRGLTTAGVLTDPDPLEAQVKRSMIRHARRSAVLVDGSKLDRAALSVIATAEDVGVIFAADVEADAVRALTRAGVDVRLV